MDAALGTAFEASSAQALFESERSIRENFYSFKKWVAGLIDDLPLAKMYNSFHLPIVEGKMRKDGITHSAIHQQRHLVVANHILGPAVFITEELAKKWGSKDVAIAAIPPHDMREDDDMTEGHIRRTLERQIDQHYYDGQANLASPAALYDHILYDDSNTVLFIVDCLTRNDGNIVRHNGDRDAQMFSSLHHPYAFFVKQIDWNDKLATMIGVEHFEKDGQKGILKVLEETAHYFLNDDLGFARQASEKYPFMADQYQKLDRLMGLQYNLLLRYVSCYPGNENIAKTHRWEPLENFLPDALELLEGLPQGVHYIHNMIDRMREAANHNSKLANMLKKDIQLFAPFFETEDSAMSSQIGASQNIAGQALYCT